VWRGIVIRDFPDYKTTQEKDDVDWKELYHVLSTRSIAFTPFPVTGWVFIKFSFQVFFNSFLSLLNRRIETLENIMKVVISGPCMNYYLQI